MIPQPLSSRAAIEAEALEEIRELQAAIEKWQNRYDLAWDDTEEQERIEIIIETLQGEINAMLPLG